MHTAEALRADTNRQQVHGKGKPVSFIFYVSLRGRIFHSSPFNTRPLRFNPNYAGVNTLLFFRVSLPVARERVFDLTIY